MKSTSKKIVTEYQSEPNDLGIEDAQQYYLKQHQKIKNSSLGKGVKWMFRITKFSITGSPV
jgi:hypothetical protein